jgi:hypothetical protein
MNSHRISLTAAALLLSAAALALSAQIPEQYPRRLLHTPTDHPAAHVILLNVEGLHAIDPARYVAAQPGSSMASLSSRGVTYTGAHLTARLDKTPVPVTQLAPLLLRAFGMEKFDLEALHQENTPALPGIF